MGLFDLTGKTALVTGSSRGIGRAIAEEMARAGASIVISSRKQAACNIGDKDQVNALVDRARAEFGKIDVLVLNAAINPAFGPLADVADDALDKVMAVNVKSQLWFCSLVLPEMAARGDGAVIFIGSIGALRGSPNLGAYAMSKAAVMQMVRSLANEWGKHNIRINAIAPGLIRTDFSKALTDNKEVLAKRLAATPLGRLGEPADIAGVAVMLAGAAGRFITGQSIVVDGGAVVAG